MNLPNVLGGLAQGMMPAAPQIMAQGQPQPAPQAMPQAMPRPKENGFNNFLGFIADTLLMNSGRAPVYGPMMQEKSRKREMGTALANYLGNNDAALSELLMADPATGLELYKLNHPTPDKDPEMIRLMRIAGIDPTSDEGKGLITSKLSGGGDDGTTFTRDLRALGIDPHSPEAKTLFYGRNSPAGYLLTPDGGGEDMPTFSTPDEAKASGLPAGTHFRAPNGKVYQIPGGATASPSPTFP